MKKRMTSSRSAAQRTPSGRNVRSKRTSNFFVIHPISNS